MKKFYLIILLLSLPRFGFSQQYFSDTETQKKQEAIKRFEKLLENRNLPNNLNILFNGIRRDAKGFNYYTIETPDIIVYAPTLTPDLKKKRADSEELALKYGKIIEDVLKSYCPKDFNCPLPQKDFKVNVYLYGSEKAFINQSGIQRSPPPALATTKNDRGRIVSQKIEINLTAPNNEEVAKHETIHIFLLRIFEGKYIPAWVDEGLAVLSEREDIIQKHLTVLEQSSVKWNAKQVMSMTEFPQGPEFGLAYAHSTSLDRFLSEIIGKDNEDRPIRKLRFINFVKDGIDNGYEAALKKYYGQFGINNFNDLDKKWNAWRGF